MQTIMFEYPIRSKTGSVRQVPIVEIFNRIRSGSDQAFKASHEFQSTGKSKEYKQLKDKIHSFFPNVKKGGRRKEQIEELSGCMYIDLDSTDLEIQTGVSADWNAIKEKVVADECVFACWKSVSGHGLGILVRLNGLTLINWLTNWHKVRIHFEELTKRKVDKFTKNINRAVYISHDLDLYVNENSRILEAIPPGPEPEKYVPVKKGRLSAREGGNENSAPFFTPLFTLKADQEIFFSESFIDLHFAADLSKINFDGINNRYDGTGHYWFRNGFPYARLVGRSKPIFQGNRHKELTKTLSTASFLNPHWSEDRLKQWLWQYSSDWCPNPLKDSELERIFDFVYYDCLHGNKLIPNILYKKNHFTFESRLERAEKLSKVGQSKSHVTAIKVIDACIASMRAGEFVSNDSIMKKVDISKPTVIKHLRPLNKKAANDYIQRVKDEAKQYEGYIEEILPNFRKIILTPESEPDPEPEKE